MLIEFALRNVFRHRARSAMTLAVIALGVAALIVSAGLVANLYRQLAEAVIHSQTGHLEVATPAFFSAGSRSPEKHRIEGAAKLATQLSTVPGVSEVTARLAFTGLLSNARTQLPIIGEGIEADKAARLATSISILDGHRLGTGDR
ncbi:MAG TPA: ABC transporter permease, partial [Casimicrobiaceae bacterium]